MVIAKIMVTLVSVFGAYVGGYIAFLMRPTNALAGQLPVFTVLTRGTFLDGYNRLLLPLAQYSFEYVAIGAILGALGAMIISIGLCDRVVGYFSR